jgi:hypothetical protein
VLKIHASEVLSPYFQAATFSSIFNDFWRLQQKLKINSVGLYDYKDLTGNCGYLHILIIIIYYLNTGVGSLTLA